MSDCKWTKGEWRVVDRTTNGVQGYEICWSDDGECVTDHVYEKADADVMAASKDMYEVLDRISRRLQMDIDDGSRPDQWSMEALVRDASKAMAKANGEQQ